MSTTIPAEKAAQQRRNGEFFVPQVVLKVEGLVKIYGKRRVVDGVDFHVSQGEIVGLIGPNGAGKTTSFKMACGLIDTNGGVVFLNGKDVTSWPMYRRARDGGMGFLPQDSSVIATLSVQNNLLGVMEMLGMDSKTRHKRCDELLEKLNLKHLRRNYAGGLSGGERRRLEVARSLINNPKIILLDEPFAAIDPITIEGIQVIIRQLAAEGISILVTDHSVDHLLNVIDRSYVISAGRVLCHGTSEEVLANEEAVEVYFGKNYALKNNFSKKVGAHHGSGPKSMPTHATSEKRHPELPPGIEQQTTEPIAKPQPKQMPNPVAIPRRPITDIPSRPLVRSIQPKDTEQKE